MPFPLSPDYYKRGYAWRPDDWALSDVPDDLPPISIGVLSYNRLPALRLTLDVLTRGDQYPRKQIIVLDNASTDGTQEMVRREYPDVLLLALSDNKGTSARNRFREVATGKYLFNYDDDSMPATPATLIHIVRYMESHPDVDALFPMCYQPVAGFLETGEEHKFRLSGSREDGYRGVYSVEGGACYRMSSLLKVKGYDERLVWGAEGTELSLQMYRAGLTMVLHEGFATLHMKSQLNRADARNTAFRARHTVWLLFKHFPAPVAWALATAYLGRRTVDLVKKPDVARHGIEAVIKAMMRNFPFRSEKPKMTMSQIIGLKRWFLGLLRW